MASHKSPEHLEDILARCLYAVEQGRATPDECLAAFPEHATALAPLLNAALTLQNAAHPSLPAARVALLERKVTARTKEHAAKSSPPRRRAQKARPAWRWAAAAGLVLTVILLSGAGTVAAANNSLPGDPLYNVKRNVEKLQLRLASEERKPDLLADSAEERLEEVETLLEEGEVYAEVIDDLVEANQSALEAMEGTSNTQREELAQKLALLSERQQTVLTRMIEDEDAPPQAQQGLQRALEASQHGHERAIQAMTGQRETGPPDHAGPPDGEAPGQQNEPPGQQNEPPGQQQEATEDETEPPGQQNEPPGQRNGPQCESPPCGQGQGQGQGNNK